MKKKRKCYVEIKRVNWKWIYSYPFNIIIGVANILLNFCFLSLCLLFLLVPILNYPISKLLQNSFDRILDTEFEDFLMKQKYYVKGKK